MQCNMHHCIWWSDKGVIQIEMLSLQSFKVFLESVQFSLYLFIYLFVCLLFIYLFIYLFIESFSWMGTSTHMILHIISDSIKSKGAFHLFFISFFFLCYFGFCLLFYVEFQVYSSLVATNSRKPSGFWRNNMLHLNQDGIIVLNVAEKNDAAKNIAQIMSKGRSTRVSWHIFLSLKQFSFLCLEIFC